MISAPYQKIQHDNEDFFAFLSNQTGEIIDLGNIGFLNDVFLVEVNFENENSFQMSLRHNKYRFKFVASSQLASTKLDEQPSARKDYELEPAVK